MTQTPRIRRNDEVLTAEAEGETFLLEPSTWTYVNFNETGALIWEALDEPRTLDEVVDMLLRDYAVDRATCESEVAAFVREMSDKRVLIAEPAA